MLFARRKKRWILSSRGIVRVITLDYCDLNGGSPPSSLYSLLTIGADPCVSPPHSRRFNIGGRLFICESMPCSHNRAEITSGETPVMKRMKPSIWGNRPILSCHRSLDFVFNRIRDLSVAAARLTRNDRDGIVPVLLSFRAKREIPGMFLLRIPPLNQRPSLGDEAHP